MKYASVVLLGVVSAVLAIRWLNIKTASRITVGEPKFLGETSRFGTASKVMDPWHFGDEITVDPNAKLYGPNEKMPLNLSFW